MLYCLLLFHVLLIVQMTGIKQVTITGSGYGVSMHIIASRLYRNVAYTCAMYT